MIFVLISCPGLTDVKHGSDFRILENLHKSFNSTNWKEVVTTPTKLQRNINLNCCWVWHENDFAHHPPTQTQLQQYFSCYWPNFDQTLKMGFRDHHQQQHQHHHHQQEQNQIQKQKQHYSSYSWPNFTVWSKSGLLLLLWLFCYYCLLLLLL